MSISAVVAEVLSDTEVVLNVGADDGVSLDDLAVLVRDVAVSDPETGEELGTVVRPMLRMRVSEVQPRLAIAVSIEPISNPDPLDVFFAKGATMRVTTRVSEASPSVLLVQRGFRVVIQRTAAKAG